MPGNHKQGFARARKRLIEGLTEGVKDVGEYAAGRLILYTPVISGRLRGGWSVRMNQLPDETNQLDKTGEATLQAIHAALQSFKLGDTINVVDRVFYGPFVNDGTARMAPRNMTGRAVADVKLRAAEIIARRWQRQ